MWREPNKCQVTAGVYDPRLLKSKAISVQTTLCGPGNGLKFNLIDKVEHLSGERIVAVKYVSLAEEYLADHFPSFLRI